MKNEIIPFGISFENVKEGHVKRAGWYDSKLEIWVGRPGSPTVSAPSQKPDEESGYTTGCGSTTWSSSEEIVITHTSTA